MIRADGLRKLHLAEFRDRPVECEWKIVNFIQNVKIGAGGINSFEEFYYFDGFEKYSNSDNS